MAKAVVTGATLQCNCGNAPAKLIVDTQTQFTIDGQPVGTILDFKPSANIPSFGTCSLLSAAASGTPTPCTPAPAGPWMPGSATQVQISDQLALLSTDRLTCGVGGVISIQDSGQQQTEIA
jgi:Domain of unknown function (DUF4280)